MTDIKFTNQETEALVTKLQTYFEQELDQDLEQFDAQFLLDFISKEMGGYFYNKGLHDARTILDAKIQSIDEDLYAIEKEIS